MVKKVLEEVADAMLLNVLGQANAITKMKPKLNEMRITEEETF
jgi:hypothetical protein